jgi:hypothetical protein
VRGKALLANPLGAGPAAIITTVQTLSEIGPGKMASDV